MKKIVVTGGCGFIGANLVRHILGEVEDVALLNIDALTYAGSRENLRDVEEDPRYRFEQVDIRDHETISSLFASYQPDEVYHLAAESHVDNSISGPGDFITTNVVGTYNLLMASLAVMKGGGNIRFLHVSTDEVYGELGEEGVFREDDPYRPNSPYSASKAGSDHLVRAWGATYGLDVVTTNCSNNFGPFQHPEKLIPTVIGAAMEGRPIPVYGQGENVRDWLWVGDHCSALLRVMESGERGQTYLIGTRNEWKNIDLVHLICRILDEERETGPEGGHASLITYVTDRPGHDHRYAVDPTRVERELGWRAEKDFEVGMRDTIRWYLDHLESSRSQPTGISARGTE